MVTEIKNNYNNLAIVGFILSLFPISSIAGLPLSIRAINQIEKFPMRGRRLAIAGVILGSVWAIFNFMFILTAIIIIIQVIVS